MTQITIAFDEKFDLENGELKLNTGDLEAGYGSTREVWEFSPENDAVQIDNSGDYDEEYYYPYSSIDLNNSIDTDLMPLAGDPNITCEGLSVRVYCNEPLYSSNENTKIILTNEYGDCSTSFPAVSASEYCTFEILNPGAVGYQKVWGMDSNS